jgi:hypothetical protein
LVELLNAYFIDDISKVGRGDLVKNTYLGVKKSFLGVLSIPKWGVFNIGILE